MVRSTVSNMNYTENYSIVAKDENIITKIYELEYVALPQAKEFVREELEPEEIKKIQIGLGEMRQTSRNKEYVFKPIYAIQNGKTVARIGYYEIHKDEISGEELSVEDMYEPLMFMYEGIKKYLEPNHSVINNQETKASTVESGESGESNRIE